MEITRKSVPLWRALANMRLLRALSLKKQSMINCRCMSSGVSGGRPEIEGNTQKLHSISRAMKAYLERAQAHESFMSKEVADYEIGKRHLARMMGADPENFTQEDVDTAVQYLLPSGLYDKKSRPMVKHPSEIIPKRTIAHFGMDGRPYHPLFYTFFYNYYEKLHEFGMMFEELKRFDNTMTQRGVKPIQDLNLASSQWVDKNVLKKMLEEDLTDGMYFQFINLLERIATHPWAHRHQETIFKYRKMLTTQANVRDIPELLESESGRLYQKAHGTRKTAKADVTVWDQGTGQVSINGKNLLSYFPKIVDREQIMFPLQFTNKLGIVDFEAVVEGGGNSGQAGALRLALSYALQSFVTKDMVEKMRLAGLLTRDPRMRERKKYGQEGARRKYTWKKR